MSPEPNAHKVGKGTVTDALRAAGRPTEATEVENRLDRLESFSGDVGHFLESRFGPPKEVEEPAENGTEAVEV